MDQQIIQMCGRRQQTRNIHHAELLVRLYCRCLPSFKQKHPAIGWVFEVVNSFILGELNEKKIAPDELSHAPVAAPSPKRQPNERWI